MRLSEGCELLVTVFIAVLICLRATLLAEFLEQKKAAESGFGSFQPRMDTTRKVLGVYFFFKITRHEEPTCFRK